jgi:cytochrome c biogenesis protein CcmG/thiol:disulfide interchange protein DsbE
VTTLAAEPDAPPATRSGGSHRRVWRMLALLVTVAVIGLVLVTRLEGQPPARSVLLDGPAPPLTGTTLDGEAFDLGDWRGQVVLVNVWASWCVPCQQEQPLLVGSYRELAPRGLQIVGINVRDEPEEARAFMQDFGQAPWPSVQDPDGRHAVDWGTFALPETYLVDPSGTIVAKAVGELDAAWIRDNVTPLLAAAGP